MVIKEENIMIEDIFDFLDSLLEAVVGLLIPLLYAVPIAVLIAVVAELI